MALTIIKEPGQGVKQIVAQERFIVTVDGSRLVGPGESGQLLAAPGNLIPEHVAAKLGIGPDGRRLPAKGSDYVETGDTVTFKEPPAPETKVILPAKRGRKK